MDWFLYHTDRRHEIVDIRNPGKILASFLIQSVDCTNNG